MWSAARSCHQPRLHQRLPSTIEHLAAIDDQGLSSNPASPRRRQEQRRMRDFLRRTKTAERNLRQDGGIALWTLMLAAIPHATGELDRTGCDGIDADALFGQYQRLRRGVM